MKPYGPEYKSRSVKPKAPPAKYQWPANKLTSDDMAILFRLRESTGTPINRLLQEAIQKLGELIPPQSSQTSSEPGMGKPTTEE